MMQGMMEFAEPIMAYVEDGTIEDANDALQVGLHLWNSTLLDDPIGIRQSRTELVDLIRNTLKLDRDEAEAFFDRMLERKAYLFPEDIQPEGGMTLFMRKEVEYLITQFEESQLNLSDEATPPDGEDYDFLNALHHLDAQIDVGEDYGEWEGNFFDMQELCCQRYQHWLQAKGVPETYHSQFTFCVETYLNFIYQYDEGNLKDVSRQVIEEFLMDYLLRKVMAQPPEYTQWPPALRLFYRFLAEKGYLDRAEWTMARWSAVEPAFIALVRQRS